MSSEDPGSEVSDPIAATSAVRDGRRYDDEAVRRILKGAAELQAQAGTVGSASGRGLSLDEIREIAAEAGIDPRYVDLAMTEGITPAERRDWALLGAPIRWQFHEDIAGVVPEEARARIVQAVRAVAGQRGDVDEVYGRMEWTFNDGLGPVVLGLANDDETTTLDLSAARKEEVTLIYGLTVPFLGLFGGGALSASLGLSGVPQLAFAAGTLLGAMGLARLVWKARARYLEGLYHRVMAAASAIARDAAVTPESPDDE